jgi:tetratricopeptide (TPR) repeat protein
MTILKSRVEAEPDRADYQRDLSVSYNKLGDLLQALGQGEAARQYYQQSLEIRQRLVAAEPDRADYQWDLVVSLLRMAAVEPDNSTEHRARALAILRDLYATDQLFPEQENLMRELEQELRTED